MSHESSPETVLIELLRKYDRPGPRYTSYPSVPEWSKEIGPNEYVNALERASKNAETPLALYCHIPFCERRCYYCGCNTVITRNGDRVAAYLKLLGEEIELVASHLGRRNKVNQLHFGGGTPTFLDVESLGGLLDKFDRHFEYISGCEKSVEVDPRVTSFEQLEFLTSRGFNRISIGVQDFDPEVQRASGRVQSIEEVKCTIDHSRKLGFKGINIDLIYGLPKQTVTKFAETIDKAIGLGPDRVAVYSFAYLPEMKAHQARIKTEDLPQTEEKYGLFAKAIEKFTSAGYRQIGMDHFALPEDELAVAQADGRLSRNFMGYTVQTSPDMVGIGMSSIGQIGGGFFQSHSHLGSYNEALSSGKLAVFRGKVMSDDDLVRQYLITSLMCNFRLDYDQLKKRFGVEYKEYFAEEHAGLAEFFDDEFLTETEHGLMITPLGRTFVRNIAMVYDAYFHRATDGIRPAFSQTI